MNEEMGKPERIGKYVNLEDIYSLKELGLDHETIEILKKPMRKKLDVETLKKEQNFTPIDKKVFFQKIDELNIKESIDDLLTMI